jgi:hypothetical protein
MAWSAPMTAVANDIFTAAQFNTYVRDNLLETATAKASTVGGYFVASGTNSLSQRVSSGAVVATSQTTASTSYTDLATTGPAVTVTSGTSAMVWFGCRIGNDTVNIPSWASYAVSGATTIAASDEWAIKTGGMAAGSTARFGTAHYHAADLTAGSNVFTMKYKVQANTGTFVSREILVLPL